MSVMSRTKAREIALHLIFEMGFQQFEEENLEERLDESIMASISGDIALYAGKLSPAQTDYIRAVVKGVAARREELDETITAYSKGWKISRMSRMTVAVLRLALYEMRYVDDVPVGAAINEAVELAKVYDTDEAAAFINGVLGAAARAAGETDVPASEQAASAENANA
ncbi:MAG TPA: transcription antitermination factor NusB [Candidatus Agathobaculum merdavium]|nr:transcription antitermination factor NusB [Candidatus Agathobaculum merdavium]